MVGPCVAVPPPAAAATATRWEMSRVVLLLRARLSGERQTSGTQQRQAHCYPDSRTEEPDQQTNPFFFLFLSAGCHSGSPTSQQERATASRKGFVMVVSITLSNLFYSRPSDPIFPPEATKKPKIFEKTGQICVAK